MASKVNKAQLFFENVQHHKDCPTKKDLPEEIQVDQEQNGKNIEVGGYQVVVVPYTDCSKMNVYAPHISIEKFCSEDVIIAIGKKQVIFARLPNNICLPCLEAASQVVANEIASFLITERGVIEVFVLIPSYSEGGNLKPIYLNDPQDADAHGNILGKIFWANERWKTVLRAYIPSQLNHPLPNIIQVGDWNKNGTPAVRINDLKMDARVLVNDGENAMARFLEDIPL